MTQINTPTGRYYEWRDGGKFVSVTTAIGDGIPKPGLARWLAKQVAETAARERKALAQISNAKDVVEHLMSSISKGKDLTAANTGSKVHAVAEMLALGHDPLVEPESAEAPYVERYKDFVVDWKPVYIEAEASVYNRTHGYAGTLDAIVEIGGKRYVLDIKTGKSVWPEVALQLAAYANAEFIGRPDGREDALPTCRRGLVLHLRPDKYELVPVVIDDTVFDAFLSALDIHRWMKDTSKYVIGSGKSASNEEGGAIDA
jgi:hypothetical protein